MGLELASKGISPGTGANTATLGAVPVPFARTLSLFENVSFGSKIFATVSVP